MKIDTDAATAAAELLQLLLLLLLHVFNHVLAVKLGVAAASVACI